MGFEPDYRHVVAAARNQRPRRLPLYEHIICNEVMAATTDARPAPDETPDGLREYYEGYCHFWKTMTYDCVSWEAGVIEILPEHGAILGGRPGPIQNRSDFERFPFVELPELYWQRWKPHVEALAASLPPGMKIVGGIGNGAFEISEDLVGYEYLCLMQYDDPELFAKLYTTIGDLLVTLWSRMLERYGDLFAVCRAGDDLGFKTSTLLAPNMIIEHVVPQHRRVIEQVHRHGRPFLLHSCGNIFSVMPALLGAGIDAKHSNEDQIAPFTRWIEDYNDRIGLFGGIDVDLLTRTDAKTIFDEVVRQGTRYRQAARGFALGSGNSIPSYVPPENYVAMVEAVQALRRREGSI